MSRYVGVGVGIIGVVLGIAAFVGPWWVVDTRASILGQTFGGTNEFRLLGGSSSVQTPAGPSSETTDYSGSPNTAFVFRVSTALAGLAIVCGSLFVLAATRSSSRARGSRWVALFGVLAFLLPLAGPIYVMAELPNAFNRDGGTAGTEIAGFWGSRSVSLFGTTATIAWSAGWAWYSTLLMAIVFLAAGIASRRASAAARSGSPPP